METANLPTFVQFGNAKKSDVLSCKKLWVVTKLGSLEQTWGTCAPGPGVKPSLSVTTLSWKQSCNVVERVANRALLTYGG